jgi:hypothetical protein
VFGTVNHPSHCCLKVKSAMEAHEMDRLDAWWSSRQQRLNDTVEKAKKYGGKGMLSLGWVMGVPNLLRQGSIRPSPLNPQTNCSM